MRRFTVLFAVAATAAAFAAPTFAAESRHEIARAAEVERTTSADLAAILTATYTPMPLFATASRDLNQQVAQWGRNYGHSNSHYRHGGGHYDYHPGHYDRHRGHYDYHPGHYDYHRGGHGYYQRRSSYQPYYGSGIYLSRPGFSIGLGF